MMRIGIPAVLAGAVALLPAPAGAVSIDVVAFEPDRLAVTLTDIDQVSDRVYTLDRDSGEVRFGDGIPGARPPSGRSGVIASYRTGGGTSGNVVNEYALFDAELPLLIPIADFLEPGSNAKDASFVVSGVSALGLELSDQGLKVTAAELLTRVPEPALPALFATALAALALLRRRQGDIPLPSTS